MYNTRYIYTYIVAIMYYVYICMYMMYIRYNTYSIDYYVLYHIIY